MSGIDAKAAANLFDPDRLRLARQLKRLKRVDLARLGGVSPAAISQYESGKSRPRPGTLAELAMHLGMPVGFFASTGRPVPPLDTAQGFFRSLRSTTQLDRDAALAQAAILADVVAVVEQRVVLPTLDLPQDLAVQPSTSLDEIEGIAATVNFDHIKRHYYMTHGEINPTRIVPIGPALDLTAPHGREKLP